MSIASQKAATLKFCDAEAILKGIVCPVSCPRILKMDDLAVFFVPLCTILVVLSWIKAWSQQDVAVQIHAQLVSFVAASLAVQYALCRWRHGRAYWVAAHRILAFLLAPRSNFGLTRQLPVMPGAYGPLQDWVGLVFGETGNQPPALPSHCCCVCTALPYSCVAKNTGHCPSLMGAVT